MKLVKQDDRKNATSSAKSLLQHQLYRTWDAVNEAMEKVGANDVSAMGQIAKVASLAGTAQQLSRTWMAFVMDEQRGQEAEKAAEPAPESLTAAAAAAGASADARVPIADSDIPL